MNRKNIGNGSLFFLLRCLLFSYLLTGACLLLLALLLYRLRLSEQVISVALIVIYVAAVFLAGFLTGKGMKNRKISVGTCGGNRVFCGHGSGLSCGESWPEGTGYTLFYNHDPVYGRRDAGRHAELMPQPAHGGQQPAVAPTSLPSPPGCHCHPAATVAWLPLSPGRSRMPLLFCRRLNSNEEIFIQEVF